MLLRFFAPNPKRGWASRMVSLRRNLFLVLPPAVIAAVMTAAWYQFFRRGLHLPESVKEMLGTAIVVQAAIFAIAAAMVLNGTWERVRALSRHVLIRNQRGFMEIRDEKMPIPMHLVLAASGLSVLVLLGAAPYPDAWSGGIIVSSTWFVMSLYFMIVASLQNITSSVWIANRVPKDWLETEVDKFFSTGFSEFAPTEVQQVTEPAGADAPTRS
jgi:hypothetical protein